MQDTVLGPVRGRGAVLLLPEHSPVASHHAAFFLHIPMHMKRGN